MAFPFDEVTRWVTEPLQAANLPDYSLWWIDVPEFLRTPRELYMRLGGSQPADALEYQAVEPTFAKMIEQHGTLQGVILRHQRLLWQVNLPE